MPLASDENTPLQGEHFPGSGGPRGFDGARWQIFGPIVAALVVVGAAYAWSLKAPRTVTGLKAGGQPIGDVPHAQLDGALDRVVDGFLDTRIVVGIGTDQRVVRRRDVGFVVDRAAARELVRG